MTCGNYGGEDGIACPVISVQSPDRAARGAIPDRVTADTGKLEPVAGAQLALEP